MKMNYKNAIEMIKAGNVSPVYFLNGDDFFKQDYFIKHVEKYFSQGKPINKVVLIPEVTDYTTILAELTSVSLFAETKLFILRNPTQIKGNKRKELLAYCKSPNQGNCLIIIIDKYDARSKLIKDLTSIIGSVNTSPPFPDKMLESVEILLKHEQLSAEKAAIDSLIELSGDSLYHIFNEINKIKIDLGDKENFITKDLVLKHAGWDRNYFPWHLLDAVGKREFSTSVHIGEKLLQQGIEISVIISQLTRMFQELYFRHLPGDFHKKDMKKIWLSREIIKRLPNYKRKYKKGHIKPAFRFLRDADKKVKSTGIDERTILIPLLFQITHSYG